MIVQFGSHERALLNYGSNDGLTGDRIALARFRSLVQSAVRWYASAGVLYLGIVGAGGVAFFSRAGSDGIYWLWPWLCIVIVSCLNFLLVPLYQTLLAVDEVVSYWRQRLGQRIVYVTLICAAIALGAGLWALVVASASSVIWGSLYLRRTHWPLIKGSFVASAESGMNWKEEVWPMQWRVAVSFASGYLVSYALTPLAFLASGPVLAGKVGMTISILSVLSAVAANWLSTKVPRFGMFVARGEVERLNREFGAALGQAAIVASAGSIAVSVGLVVGAWLHLGFVGRLLSPGGAVAVLLGGVIGVMVQGLCVYFRAFKREPLAGFLFVNAILVVVVSYFGARFWGGLGLGLGYLGVSLLLQAPGAYWVYHNFRYRADRVTAA